MKFASAILLSFLSGQALAQDSVQEIAQSFSDDFSAQNTYASEEDCRARLSERQDNFIKAGAADIKPMELILEANRIICERYRILAQLVSTESERERLRREADRLDAVWARDKASDPDGVTDFPGRDKSQRALRAQARALDLVARSLTVVATDLATESERLLILAIEDVDRFGPSEKRLMQLAADADGEKSLQEGFRDLLPKTS